jgi:hypothetical protein
MHSERIIVLPLALIALAGCAGNVMDPEERTVTGEQALTEVTVKLPVIEDPIYQHPVFKGPFLLVPELVTFDGVTSGTNLSQTQPYAPGVAFSAVTGGAQNGCNTTTPASFVAAPPGFYGSVFAVSDPWIGGSAAPACPSGLEATLCPPAPGGNVVSLDSGYPYFTGMAQGNVQPTQIMATFGSPATWVSISTRWTLSAEYLGPVFPPYLAAFDANDNCLGEMVAPTTSAGQTWEMLYVSAPAGTTISYVIFSTQYAPLDTPVWAEFDDLQYL